MAALLLLVSACASTPSEPRAPRVELGWRGQFARLWIHNPLNAERLEIVDPKFNRLDWPPIGVYVRASDQTGAIMRHGTDEGEGWWTELSLSSNWRDAVASVDFSMPPIEPPALLTLDPGDQLEVELDPRLLVEGLRPEHVPETDICRVQVRVAIYDSRLQAAVNRTTDWQEMPCVELFGADWMQYFRGRPSDEEELQRLLEAEQERRQP